MNGCTLLLIAVAYFVCFYFVYGKFLSKVFKIDPKRKTPAHTEYDGVDFVPTPSYVLFGHHFASIAGAGPILGPIFAAELGWIPALIWIFIGCVFVGAMHDFASLFLSVRNKGKSISSIIEDLIGYTGRLIFSIFCWAALILVVAIFGIMVASIFVKTPSVATASLIFIALSPIFAFFVNKKILNFGLATSIFVPLTFASVFIGLYFPLDLIQICNQFGYSITEEQCKNIWLVVLGLYVFLASVIPVHWLLQPRDYLNSFMLYAMLILGFVGIIAFNPEIQQIGFHGMSISSSSGTTKYVFPTLFILIACGACSGFHSLVASGTTSKQVASESHIQPIGYGGMLVEGVLAVMSLITVIYLADADFSHAVANPQETFAVGLSVFSEKVGLPRDISYSFITLVLAAFMMTTLDTSTRLGRFVWQEIITGKDTNRKERYQGTIAKISKFLSNSIVASIIIVLCAGFMTLSGSAQAIWPLFGASNQLLSALTLLGISLYLLNKKEHSYIAIIPMVFMLTMSSWGLIDIICAGKSSILTYSSSFLLSLTMLLIILAIKKIIFNIRNK